VYENTIMRSATRRLNLWLLTAFLLTALPLAARAQNASSSFATCAVRHNRADFDGDCKTDISTFNRSTGYWDVRNSTNNQITSTPYGQSGDIPAPGDYNGDGKTDRAVFRPGNGNATWFIATAVTTGLSSVVTASYAQPFGVSSDIPVARDYDGDNKTDIAVFRPGTATWHILNSSTNLMSSVQFGATGDRVVPGDYDGDGKEDVAVFRPSNAYWYILNSSNNTMSAVQWGVTSDWPVQADYDGDGKTDVAIFRPSTGQWAIVRSSNNSSYYYTWGLSGDRPVPGDYDGDSKADIAVQRPSDGAWHIVRSSIGDYYTILFVSPEFPVPGAYLTPLY
jgi:FG-GAP-like repeat